MNPVETELSQLRERGAGEAGLLEVDGGGGEGVDVLLIDDAVAVGVPGGVGFAVGGDVFGEEEGVGHVDAAVGVKVAFDGSFRDRGGRRRWAVEDDGER